MKKVKLFFIAMALMVSSVAFAQNITVKGTVKDAASGETIPFAAVQLKGTSNGVATDLDGAYTISVPSNGTLVVSSVGYVTVEVAVAGKSVHDVALSPDTEALEGVVVTAQGLTRKDKSIGYSTVKIDGEDLTIARQTDLGQSLAGKVSGARFYSSGGTTFDSGSIVLRGTSSYTSETGTEPIYVVDGTITNKNAVNMDDVENINVLKGPAATALYGAEGAYGAVIITTKGAKAGQTHVEFSHTTTMERYYNHAKIQKEYGGGSYGMYADYSDFMGTTGDLTSAAFLYSGQAYADYYAYYGYSINPAKYARFNDDGSFYMDLNSDESWGPRFDKNVMYAPANYYDPTSSKYQQAEPWVANLDLGDLYRTGWTNTTNVAFSKAGPGYNTRVSFTNSDRTGITYNSQAIRRYLTAKSTIQATPWLKATLDYKFTYRKTKNAASDGYGSVTNPYYDFIQWGHTNVNIADYKDYLRPDGTWRTWNPTSKTNLTPKFHDNPFGVYDNHNSYGTYIWNVITGDVEATLPFNIKAGARVMGNIRNYSGESKYAEGSINYDPYYGISKNNTMDMTYQGRLTWNGSFINDRLGIDAAAFIEQKDYEYSTLSSNTNGGLTINNYYNLAASVSAYSTSNSLTQYKTRSVFGNATIAFDDTYFVDLSLRNDWDSRLPVGNNSYLYGGASASIMLSSFINAKWLDFWKLRASAAQVGSTMGAYATTYVYPAGTKYNSTGTQSMPYTQLNQNIKPTISTSYEVGTEFKMFKNRFYGDINFYQKDIKNQIMNVMVPTQTGYYYRQVNAGLITNKGIEIALGGTPINTKDWTLSLNGNISKNVNTLQALYGDLDNVMLEGNSFYYYWYLRSKIGDPIGNITTMARFARDDNGNLLLYKTGGSAEYGDYQYDIEEGEHKVGNYQPDWIGGLSASLRWKNITASANLDFSIGGQAVSWTNMWGYGSGILAESSYINDRGVNVREPLSANGGIHIKGIDGDTGEPVDTYVPAYNWMHDTAYYDLDNWIYDRTYVKLRELSVAYQLPKKVLNKMNIGLSQASIAFVATNPWLIYSAIPNMDASELGTNWLEGGQTPSTRSFGLTLKLTF